MRFERDDELIVSTILECPGSLSSAFDNAWQIAVTAKAVRLPLSEQGLYADLIGPL